MRNRTGTGKRGIGRALYAALLLIVAITLMVMGGYLMSLGGSAYFLLAGLAVLAAAILALRGDHRAPPVYALMLLGTLGWSLWEAGADPWALVSRLAAPIVLGLPMLWMWLGKGRRRTIGFGSLAFAVALLLGISLASPVAPPEAFIASTAPEGSGDWPYVGRDIGGTRYAPLTQINTANVNRLRAAWTYSAGSQISEATPLKIGDSLYFCTFDNQVIALDAETGAQRWRFDPKLAANRPAKFCRGVAYHQTAMRHRARPARRGFSPAPATRA